MIIEESNNNGNVGRTGFQNADGQPPHPSSPHPPASARVDAREALIEDITDSVIDMLVDTGSGRLSATLFMSNSPTPVRFYTGKAISSIDQ